MNEDDALYEAAKLVLELLDLTESTIEMEEMDGDGARQAKSDSDAAFSALLGLEGFEAVNVEGATLGKALDNLFEQDHEIDYTDSEERAAVLAVVNAQKAIAECVRDA